MKARAGALIGIACVLAMAACGGGGSSAPGVGPGPSPSPGGSSRPANNGDIFHYGGTLLQTFWRPAQPGPSNAPSPEPTRTTAWTVDAVSNVATNTMFHGQTGLTDFAETEVDTGLQTITTVADHYFLFPAGAGPLIDVGHRSLDSNFVLIDLLHFTGNGVVDMLPETSGATWSNSAALTSNETDPDGQTSTRTVSPDGSYTQDDAFPDGSSSSAVANSDGSGSYKVLQGSSQETDYSYGAPAGGNIVITVTRPHASPQPTPKIITVPNWQPAGSLASDGFVDNGAVAIPAACGVPANFGTQGNDIAEHHTATDALFGTLDDLTEHTYVAQGRGVVCVTLHDLVTGFYDFSGQNGLAFFGGTPVQYTTVDETLGLKVEKVLVIAGRRAAAFGAHGATRLRSALRLRSARELHALAIARNTVRLLPSARRTPTP